MSLYPGAPRWDAAKKKYELDDTGLEQSMARAMEDEMRYVFETVKEIPLPEMGQDDRRLLFVAISRGVLRCLRDHQPTITVPIVGGLPLTGTLTSKVGLNVLMDGHPKHHVLRLRPDQIGPEGISDGIVELSDPALFNGAKVNLSSDEPTIAAPASLSVKVPAGERTASFTIVAAKHATPIDKFVNIKATFEDGAEQTARLRVFRS